MDKRYLLIAAGSDNDKLANIIYLKKQLWSFEAYLISHGVYGIRSFYDLTEIQNKFDAEKVVIFPVKNILFKYLFKDDSRKRFEEFVKLTEKPTSIFENVDEHLIESN